MEPNRQDEQDFLEQQRDYYRALSEHRQRYRKDTDHLTDKVFAAMIVIIGSAVTAAWAGDRVGVPPEPAAVLGAGIGLATLWQTRGGTRDGVRDAAENDNDTGDRPS